MRENFIDSNQTTTRPDYTWQNPLHYIINDGILHWLNLYVMICMPLTSVYSLKPLLASDRLSLASRLPGEAVYAFTILLAPSRSLRCIQYASYSSSICKHSNTTDKDWHQQLCVDL